MDSLPIDGPARTDKLADAHALERLVDAILTPKMLSEVCLEWGITQSRLTRWIAADSTRSARVREARKLAAGAYEEKAQKAIADAKDDFELKKAKELAHHLRWKASKADPGEFGEKVEIGQPGDFSKASDADLCGRLDALLPGLGAVARVQLETGGGHAVH